MALRCTRRNQGRKRASAVYNACSMVLVAVAALVASDWPPGWCYAIPAAAVIVCILGKRKSSSVLPGSAPVLMLQAVMLVLFYSGLVTRSAALLPLPALLVIFLHHREIQLVTLFHFFVVHRNQDVDIEQRFFRTFEYRVVRRRWWYCESVRLRCMFTSPGLCVLRINHSGLIVPASSFLEVPELTGVSK